MAARIIPVSPFYTYNFVSTGSSTDFQLIPIGPRAIDTHWAVSGVLQVSVQSITLPSGASITVGLNDVAIYPEDPGTIFFTPGRAPSTTLGLSAGSAEMQMTQIATPIGLMVQGLLIFGGGTTGAGTPASVSMRVDLILRDA